MNSYNFSSFSQPSQNFRRPDECPVRLPLSQTAVMEELTKPISARGRGKAKKRSLVKPPSLPNMGQSFFGSFDDVKGSRQFQHQPSLPPSQVQQSPLSLTRRRTLANIEELRRSQDFQEEQWLGGWLTEQSLADLQEQLAENSSQMLTEVVPRIVNDGVNKVWASFSTHTQTSRLKLGSMKERLQQRTEVIVASTAQLEGKYRELEELELQYRAVRTCREGRGRNTEM